MGGAEDEKKYGCENVISIGLQLAYTKGCQLWCEYAQIFRNVISHQDYRTIFTVFGVKSVADILQNISEHQYLETLNSFLFEATARIENPTKGCTALLDSLEQKVEELQARVTALEARLEGRSSCANPLYSFAPPRGSFHRQKITRLMLFRLP
ncbi:hypothetical protein LguiA_029148 [Lonicera macranthoides]